MKHNLSCTWCTLDDSWPCCTRNICIARRIIQIRIFLLIFVVISAYSLSQIEVLLKSSRVAIMTSIFLVRLTAGYFILWILCAVDLITASLYLLLVSIDFQLHIYVQCSYNFQLVPLIRFMSKRSKFILAQEWEEPVRTGVLALCAPGRNGRHDPLVGMQFCSHK